MADQRLARLFVDSMPLDMIAASQHPKSALIRLCAEHLRRDGENRAVGFFVPGRVEVLGKHTDYCGGRSLLCAVDRGVAIVAQQRDDDLIRVTDAARGEHCEVRLSRELTPTVGPWSNYPMTVGRRLCRDFGDQTLRGADIAFASDLPAAAGLSSSSAIIVAFFLALVSLNRLHQSAAFSRSIQTLEDLAHYCGCIENGSGFRSLAGDAGVGTSGGSQDQTAILCCRAGVLSQYGFAPVTHEADVAFPPGHALVVLNSGVVAEKTGAAREKYNATSRKVRTLVDLWNRATGENRATLADIVRSGAAADVRLRQVLEAGGELPFAREELIARYEQFVEESERIIPRAAAALAGGDLQSFSQLVQASTAAAVGKLCNQVRETVELVDAAFSAGARAASPFGAGFGGSVWALVSTDGLPEFVASIQHHARDVVPVTPSAGAGAVL